MGENEMVKIRFRLLQGADGYPPCDSEGLWATPLGGGAYRVANLPWFVPDVALGDVVRAVADGDGSLWAVERTEESGNCTIRVAPLDVDQRTVFDTFGAMGVFGEGLGGRVDLVAAKSARGAVLLFRPVRFLGPLPEPGVPVGQAPGSPQVQQSSCDGLIR